MNQEEADFFHWLEKGLTLSSDLESLRPHDRISLIPNQNKKAIIMHILGTFNGCVGYLRGRRIKDKTFAVDSESMVQDLLFVMLKPLFPELSFEDPSPKGAASYPIKDFYFPSIKLVLEVKYIGSRDDVKKVEKQLTDDIWKYSANPDCEELIFFVFDQHLFIADRQNFSKKMSRKKGEFLNLGRQISIETIVKP